MSETIRKLDPPEKARLAGAIWIYGGIHIAGNQPRIVITMPIPLVYQFQKDYGGEVYLGEDGYFTLQIHRLELVEHRLEEIRPFMSGEEAIQLSLALEIIKNKKSKQPSTRREKQKELIEDWKRSRDRLKRRIEDFVHSHKNEPVSKRVPHGIWNKAYDWTRFMREKGYRKIPEIVDSPDSS